jgi:hypothetical protein
MIEQEIRRLAEGLKMSELERGGVSPFPGESGRFPPDLGNQFKEPAPTKPSGGTVSEALAQLEKHAYGILDVAREIEQALIGHGPGDPGTESIAAEKFGGPVDGGGIWDKLAAQIVTIERVFAQIEEAHNHALASLK